MTQANTFASKLSVAFVAIAMALSMVAPAQAATAEEMQAQIDALMAQLAAMTTTPTSSSSMSCDFTTDMTIGAKNATDVQNFLIKKGYAIPAGATGYFGSQTASAVAAFQTANAVTPAAGYWGPKTRAVANTMCSASTDDSDDEDSTDDEDDSSSDLSGEASLDSFEIDDADETDVEEGEEEAPIAEVAVEFADGDASISRLDFAITDSEGTDSDAWDTFESFSLWVDGEMVAEASASDEDDYLGDEDLGVIRFSDLEIIGMEDEEVVITVAATINANLEVAELGEWDVDGVSVRFFDADDVATTDDGAPVTDDTATFTIEVEGAGDDLELKTSSNDIDATTLALDEDDSTEHDVFVFKLDANDSDGDITLEGLTIDLALSSSTRDLNEVVKDVMIEIDGESFTAEDFDGSAATEAVDFDIDGEVTIEAEEEVEVTVTVEFEDMDGASNLQGVTVNASVDMLDVDAEGASGEAVTIGGADQNGDSHTLRSEGLVLEITSIEAEEKIKTISNTSFDYGVFTYEFEVSAFGEDFYVDEVASIVNFVLEVDGVASTTGYTATLDIADAEDAATSDFVIESGQVAKFTLTIETNTGHDGEAQVTVNSVAYSAADDGSEELTVTATPTDDWESDKLILN